MDATINITVNVGDEPEVKIDKKDIIKKKTRKIKNGKETVLQLPEKVEGDNQRSTILDMMNL